MADNVTINVQQDNDIVNIVSSQVTEVIDINVAETTESVTLNITEEIIQVNINKVTNISAVNSVNGLTGDVVLDIPTNTSDLTNDSNFVVDASYIHTDNNFTTTLKTKLDGIADGAEVNVNADWNATTGDAQILNKPTIPAAQVNSDWNATSGVAQILNKPSLTGYGDMFKSTYDTDNTGVVDNAEAIKIIGRNSTGVTLRKGTIIYISGSTGNRPNFVKAQANGESTSAGTFGVIADDLANNTDGYALALGYLDNLDTRSNATYPFTSDTLADGDTIYLSPSTAGYITNVKPSAPNHLVYLGKVTRTSPTNGTIVYRVQNGYELEELHNVAISSVADKQLLSYDNATSLWKNKSVTTADIADSTNKRYVTDANLTTIGNQSGTNTGDETTATIKTKLGAATTSTDGYLTSANWNTFNNKLAGVHTLKTLASGQSTNVSINGAALNTITGIINRMTCIPYIPNVSFTSASLYTNVTGLLLTANARILIYSDVNGVPTTKLYESTSLDCSTTGIKTTLTGFSFVAGTTYWLTFHSSSTAIYSAYNSTQIIPISASGIQNYITYISTQTFGSAPTTLTGATLSTAAPPFIGINF